MKLSVSVRKTVQEDPYEPFTIGTSIEKEVPNSWGDQKIIEEQGAMSITLQESIEDILKERREAKKESEYGDRY